jgi:DNA repair photolyase
MTGVRWDAQRLDVVDEAALPGMPSIRGLLRSVQVPEFPGITLHEVRCRSALNAVPTPSAMPFPWTINPYRGCTHACAYCMAGDTSILMADGRQVPLADIEVGDRIIGTEKRASCRHYVETVVLAHWDTVKPAYRVALADGTQIIASGDHRFLTCRGWRHVVDLTVDDRLRGGGDELVGCGRELQVTGVKELGSELPMYDITTGTGDFIANGVVSHNCFARGTHEWLELDSGHDFDSQIVVKTNLVEVLRRELARPSWRREHVALGTNTDPYQRAEGRYRLMPGVIDALARSGTPFSILTKGTLARRDIPLLAAAARDVPVGLGVSIAIRDDALHASLEPGVPTPRARLEMVRAFTEAGLPCGVFLAPVLPGLTDDEESLDAAISAIAGAGASGVTVIPLHLRPGAREWFLTWLAREHPELVPRYRQLYRRGAYVPAEYRDWLARRVAPILARHGLDRQRGGKARGADGEPATGVPGDDEGTFPAGSLPTAAATPTAEEPEQLSLL